ncbi:hypothetical protein [Marinifilum caeruleilacunae]|uniref:YD repeat-containing protein n=1 Tax=Marinifilum caeruleilacunae TaxID=2499076 RepID=A0ABX1WU47_9BACT|nr:hypothetical protein [Marinifilum caeruleilacunae]NOU59625.1 hypothetical protein [Marinifilum caeruleilacunae]
MKQLTLLFSLILILLMGCTKTSKFKVLTAESSELKGKIKSLIEKRYSARVVNGTILEINEEGTGKIEIQKFFDNENRLELSKAFDENGKLYSITKVKTDFSKNYTGADTYDNTNKLIYVDKVINSTDSSFVIERTNLTNATKTKSKMVYDRNRLCVLISNQINESTSITWEYDRDETGKLTKTIMINEFGQHIDTTLFSVKYLEFDHKGNWTKRFDLKSGQNEKVYVYERKIKYLIE